MREGEVTATGDRTVHWYDGGPEDADLVLFWHHGTPNIGQPPGPLMKPATDRGMRWVSLDRPGYGGSDRREGRCVADVAADVALVADELGLDRFAVVGHSGGGPHALACGALLGERVRATVAIASLAPFEAGGLDWYGGMAEGGRAELEAAALGPAALAAHTETAEWDPASFTDADNAMFDGPWRWFGGIVEAALSLGPGGMIDDDVAYTRPWGFAPEAMDGSRVLLVHGGRDRIVPYAHGRWLAGAIPDAQLRTFPDDGHISVLTHAEAVLDWLMESTAT